MAENITIEDELIAPYYIRVNKTSFNLCKLDKYVKKEFASLPVKELKDEHYYETKRSLGNYSKMEDCVIAITREKIFNDRRIKKNQERKVTMNQFIAIYRDIKKEIEDLVRTINL